ncbi:MAG: hypothetical protein EPN70_21510 [Paraburkholderia sp.]|uniref:phage tail protein n=1 Tax=Paraburkholderia sp. TaxID=1926495 RepID=UPI0012237B62|nr:phage tail protein [Paraburkholderia sp.]TAM00810.1 MAG: hypothetical protein EPN70_21510 [Paraburkholderia sp.]
MASEFFTILTAVGRAKIASAMAGGPKLALSEMAVGDGRNGAYYDPDEAQRALHHEVWRGPINHLEPDPANPSWVVAELVIPDQVGGWSVREVGLFDTAGDMIAVGKYPESYKPSMSAGSNKQLYIRMIADVTNASVVELKIDPGIVLVTRTSLDQIQSPQLATVLKALCDTNRVLLGQHYL